MIDKVNVLIIGGGAAGLTASTLLSSMGVKSLLVSRHPGTSYLPKAHAIFQKTMEIYSDVGVADTIYAKATPQEQWKYTGWYAGFAGPTAEWGKQIARLECWSAGYTDPNWIRASHCAPANLPQSRLEPILKARAEHLAGDGVRFNHELISVTQNQEGVTAVIEDRGTGARYEVRARYALCCDGGRTVGPALGVAMSGPAALATNVSIHFSADLSAWARDDDVLLRFIRNPEVDILGVLVPMGPDTWGSQSKDWVFHLVAQAGVENELTDEEAMRRMRLVLGLPNFDPQIRAVSRWLLQGLTADRLRIGNVFLLGDAAHRNPPSGGLGLNTAVQDAYNICWKLAAVIGDYASDHLLDSYEEERKPVAERVVSCSLENWARHMPFDSALGLFADQTPEERWDQIRNVWRRDPASDDKRQRFYSMLATLRGEYAHLNLNFGYRYSSSAILGGPEATPADDQDVNLYRPSTTPGASLPAATLERFGEMVPLGQLAGHGRFLLIAGERGFGWCKAATRLSQELDVPLDAIRIGATEGDWLDARFEWLRSREISADGALLVRPDRFIAWRSLTSGTDPLQELRTALHAILGRPAVA